MVAELVLQALDRNRVGTAIGQHARQEEATEAGAGLREHQKGIAHRRREEPLVAGEAIAAAPRRVLHILGARCIRAHVRAALLFGHAHAHGRAALGGDGDETRVVVRGDELGQPFGCDGRIAAQRRRHRIRHRDRAQHRRFELREDQKAGGAPQMRVGLAGRGSSGCTRPRRRMQPGLDRRAEQRVIARMEFDLVDAPADAVVRVQRRAVRIGEPRMRLHGLAADLRAECAQCGRIGPRRMPAQRIDERTVAREGVVAGERAALVLDRVGGADSHRSPRAIRRA